MYQIKSLGVIQTSKVLAVIYFLMSLPFVFIMFLIALITGESQGFLFIVFPFLYGIAGFIVMVIFCWIYNAVAALVGGIEIRLE